MKPKPITENFSYRFRVAMDNILHSLLSFCLLLLFVLALYYGKLSIMHVYWLVVVMILVSFLKLIRRILLFLAIQYIERLVVEDKLNVLLKVCSFFLKSNPLLYFMNSQAKLDATVKRFLNSKLGCLKRASLAYDLLLLVFYYPLTRLLYCYLLLMRSIFSDDINQSISKRIELYMIILVILFPTTFDSSIWYDFLYFYIFFLFLFFPILSLIVYLISLIYSFLLSILKPLNDISHINKLLLFMIGNGVNFSLPFHSLSLSYPTVFTLTLMRNDVSLSSKLSGLYCNIIWPSSFTLNEDLVFAKLYLTCGSLNKTSCVWKYYYNNISFFNSKFKFYHLENDKCISYLWYKALYNVLSENWYDAWLIEFFIDLHNSHKSNPDFKPIEAESLEQLNAFVENHLYIMEMVFKLIWDIEKDWQIDPINIKAHLINQLPKNLDYPINEYSFLLFGGFNRLDGLLITPDIYQQNLNNLPSSKRLNNVLENKIIDFFISSHMNIEARISPDGHWGLFQANGLHLISLITMPDLSNVHNALAVRTCSDPENFMNLKQNAAMMAYDSLFFDDELRIREFIIKRLGENVAKWREEWKDQQSSAFSKPKL